MRWRQTCEEASPFDHQLGDGNTTVALKVGSQRVALTTAQVEEAIFWLGRIRAAMSPSEPAICPDAPDGSADNKSPGSAN
jgi:hypothetical protein